MQSVANTGEALVITEVDSSDLFNPNKKNLITDNKTLILNS